ncbi:MAG: biotin synthase BioB, partial [Pseudomonadota bacterium]
ATQALCFMAGANSIFTGDKLLTAANAGDDADSAMFARLGLKPMEGEEPLRAMKAAVGGCSGGCAA